MIINNYKLLLEFIIIFFHLSCKINIISIYLLNVIGYNLLDI